MHIARRTIMVLAFLAARVNGAAGQGVTTGGISGTIRDSLGAPVAAQVRVTHDSTGVSLEVNAAGGRFLVPGLEPGGPYTVTVRALGYRPRQRRVEHVGAGTIQDVDIALRRLASTLDTVFVDTRAGSEPAARSDGGAATILGAALLEAIPAANRDLHDFVPLVPQISSKISLSSPGLSAVGTGFRFNNFLINGVSERTLSGGVSTAFGGNRSVPLDAVQEYQVMLSPFDVRFGDFTGAFVNAVTKSGTNTFHASAFVYGRNDRLARRVDDDLSTSYKRAQYGIVLSGPMVRDRVHFLIAPEVQSFTYPAIGPAIDASGPNSSGTPVAVADLDRFSTIMSRYGLVPGDAGAVRNGNPLRNLFTRVDVALPSWNSRLAVWNNYTGSENAQFSRASRDTFSLSSYQVTGVAQTRMTAAHLHTVLPGVAYNEVLVSARSTDAKGIGAVEQPIVRVAVISPMTGGQVTLNSGTHESAQNNGGPPSSSFDVKDNVTLTLNATHALTIGAEAERFRVGRSGATNTLGVWNFASLDDFAAGRAQRYDVGIDFGNATATLTGSQYALYASERWQASDRFAMTAGLRADQLVFGSRPAYNPDVDSVFGIRTDRMPRPRVELSPRAGFTWDLSSSHHDRLSGGLGTFTGRYPLAWVQSALVANGQGNRQLTCTVLGSTANYPPPFTASPTPTTCAGGAPPTPNLRGDVDLVDPNLRPLRSLRGSLAFERDVFGGAVLTEEALITRGLSDVAVRNLNLPARRGHDPYGRVIYDSIAPNGLVRAARQPDFSEAVDVVNAPGARSYQLTTRIERAPPSGLGGSLSYTYSEARDVMTLLRVNTRGTQLWASARVVSGNHDDFTRTTSSNDIPHRVIAVGTYTASWFRSPTRFSFSYIGEAGRPFTYIAYGASGRGDLNGDGSNANDPVYIPRNALDSMEIRVTGVSDATGGEADNSPAAIAARETAQRQSLQRFIDDTPCLRRQRGRIMERNSCREPWSNTTIASLRQEVPAGGRSFDLELDVFNVLNLLNASWGAQRAAAPALLEQVQQTSALVLESRPVFRYDTTRPTWTVVTDESRFQLQIAARYRF